MQLIKSLFATALACTVHLSAVKAQEVSQAALVDSALAIIPRITALAVKDGRQLARLQGKVSQSSVTVVDTTLASSYMVYYASSVDFPAAVETRLITIPHITDTGYSYQWSAVLARDKARNNLAEGRTTELLKALTAALEKQYPAAQKRQYEFKAPGSDLPTGIFYRLAQKNQFVIGIDAWHSKIGRNTLRLFVAPAAPL